MFEFMRGKKANTVVAPVDGQAVDLNDVPDQMFSKRLLGEGVAVKYTGNELSSPVKGKITMVAKTGHAIGIKSTEGAEILIHIGLDTVELQGQGFHVLVEQGEKVQIGTPLVELDQKFFSEQKVDMITPIIVTNGDTFDVSDIYQGEIEQKNTVLFKILKK